MTTEIQLHVDTTIGRKPHTAVPFNFPPFVTGSHVFGIVTEKSDLDLVVLMTPEEVEHVLPFRENPIRSDYPQISLRFGAMNLIVCTQPLHYLAWSRAIKEAKAIVENRGLPLLKDEAKDLFRFVFADMGIEED